ncbi:hypothetical protein V6N13_022911 [Hibiscus sabdariffa]|uniref:Uncharacterized protein n=2 Tax=Hibiscus sabdariffa TaxID=183260 RepID=A0ABR2P0U1_9ROSI
MGVSVILCALSGIQLHIDRPSMRLRRPGEESDTKSSRETSSDSSNNDCRMGKTANNVVPAPGGSESAEGCRFEYREIDKPVTQEYRSFGGLSSDENDSCNPPGQQLIFEYLEHDQPFSREPFADKIAVLASRFPSLKTYRSCDLSPSSWISVAWYPIYRIQMGPTLQNLDACFLTHHSLSLQPHQVPASTWIGSPSGALMSGNFMVLTCP